MINMARWSSILLFATPFVGCTASQHCRGDQIQTIESENTRAAQVKEPGRVELYFSPCAAAGGHLVIEEIGGSSASLEITTDGGSGYQVACLPAGDYRWTFQGHRCTCEYLSLETLEPIEFSVLESDVVEAFEPDSSVNCDVAPL